MHELPQRHRITVEHFYRMAEAGLFAEDGHVELIDGEVIDVPPMGHRHAGTLDHTITKAAIRRLPTRCSTSTASRFTTIARPGTAVTR